MIFQISPKLKQLTRSEALCEECASPPLDPLKSTASTCSSDSSSSGIGTKSSFVSLYNLTIYFLVFTSLAEC